MDKDSLNIDNMSKAASSKASHASCRASQRATIGAMLLCKKQALIKKQSIED